MDENRVQGTLRNATGKMQEELGRATGDYGTQAKGHFNQAAGTAQKIYGETRDAARITGTSLDRWLPAADSEVPHHSSVFPAVPW